MENKQDSCEKKVFQHIFSADEGAVFALRDFAELGSSSAVRQSLSRLTTAGFLERVTFGIYRRAPEYCSADTIPIDPNAVAAAIARNYGWQVIPGPETAQYMLGLTKERPTSFTFLGSSRPSTYELSDGTKIVFGRLTKKAFEGISSEALTVVSAFSKISKYKVTAAQIYHLSQTLDQSTKDDLIANLSRLSARSKPVIEIICDCYGGEAADSNP